METFVIDVPMPSMGATVNELTVIDIMVEAGSKIEKGSKIAELESDKSVFEYEAPCDGEIQAVQCRAGDILPAGSPFLRIITSDDSLKHLETKGLTAAASIPTAAPVVRSAPALPSVPATVSVAPTPSVPRGPVWTPRATKLAQAAGLDPATISDIAATGPGGRVSGDDVERYLAANAAAPAPAPMVVGAVKSETVCIAGVGYAVPQSIRPTSEILKEFPGRTEAEMIKLTGIRERRYAGPGETATSLAAKAVEQALAQAGVDVGEIDGIILATIIPDQPVPSMASALALQLGIPSVFAFDLNAACSGWLYALEVGRSLITAGTARKLIVVTAEILSRITNPKDQETAFLFGDGAGAAILTDATDGHRLHRMAISGDAKQFAAIQRQGGGANRPVPDPSGNDRNDFFLQMDGGAVFKSAVIGFAKQIEDVLKRHNLQPDDIAWIVPHQANERILKAVGKRVGIPFEKIVMTISKYGNTSGASVSMALGWAAAEEIFQPGDRIVFCSVGAGLTFAGGLLVW